MAKFSSRVLVLVVALAASTVAVGAMAYSSATFDEIVLVSGGVRGLERGEWSMTMTQPPLMMYAYGAAAGLASPSLPPEEGETWGAERGWEYARALFFQMGNDPEALLGAARRVGAVLAGLLVLVAGLYAGWVAGPVAAVLAALMVAATPDVLAHGGVAYNDLPLALAFLLAVWAVDVAVRRPSPLRGAGAGAAVALALCVKMSALALAPVAFLLVLAEAGARPRDRGWWLSAGGTVAAGLLAAWATLLIMYRGDPTLTLLRLSYYSTVLRAGLGHPGDAYLLGHTSASGWWFFFPVAFFFKTPLAFQALLGLGALGLLGASRQRADGAPVWRRVARWRGRGPLLGAVIFGAFLMSSHLDSGFRYALPVLPLLAVLGAVGISRYWASGRRARGVVTVLLGLQVAAVGLAYPHLLAFTSMWAGDQDRAYPALLDSSVDWGQGLLELRGFMSDEGVQRVRLSYFGSAMPEAYGIDYVPMPSFFRLEGGRVEGQAPRFTVISATTLHGLYLQDRDPFAAYRTRQPYRVLGHTLFVYDDGGPPAGGGSSGP
ncbi:MAG TPA: glycosyltransferase family 39 protein [Longimicrobiales bacterium]|nr:glycosyltransferase family 39 protein [Longimicrobiales bacterium]